MEIVVLAVAVVGVVGLGYLMMRVAHTSPAIPPPPDPSFGDEDMKRILAVRPEAARCAEALRRMGETRRAPWDEREFYAEALGIALPIEALDARVVQAPDDPDALLLRGRRRVKWAWEARGGGYGSTVSDAARRLFHERLEGARDDLLAAARLLPDDPTPWGILMTVSYGLPVHRAEAYAWFEAARERDPEQLRAHLTMVTRSSARWRGSRQEMFDFARAVVARAPPGDLGAVWIAAFLEQQVDTGANVFADPQARAAVNHAFDQRMCAEGVKPRKTSFRAWNIAACWYFFEGDRRRLAVCLDRMAGRVHDYPWSYFGDTSTLVADAKARCAPPQTTAGHDG